MNYVDRDLSWLSFNERILQEASSPRNPLLERLKFLAIFSSNLEEFYQVRVAGQRFAQKYRGDKKNKFGYRPSYLLREINNLVSAQQERLGRIFYEELLPGLAQEGMQLLHGSLTSEEDDRISQLFDEKLQDQFDLQEITDQHTIDLKNREVYLYFLVGSRSFLLQLDYDKFGRFIQLHDDPSNMQIVQLDDVFRLNKAKIFPEGSEVFAVKISRDADLYIDEEQEASIVERIKRSINKRETGLPSRLLFDENIAFKHINDLRKKVDVDLAGLVPGGKYHNFYDFFGFPSNPDKPHLSHPPMETVLCKRLEGNSNWFETLRKEDVFLSFPYQDYKYVTEFIRRACEDRDVEEINITLYRVAKYSEICQALEIAAQHGKKVFVLSEVQARFDEESNIYWGERLQKAGATVKYGLDGLKVHAKIMTVKRKEGGKTVTYGYLGTGNFNEKTAEIYCDHAILTSDKKYTRDLKEVFKHLKDPAYEPDFKTLLVAPFTLRSVLNDLIEAEIKNAEKGIAARMTIKLNSLEDVDMINAVMKAADAGVKVDLVIRGICCIAPKTARQKENIRIVSVVGRYLEHTRIYQFHQAGKIVTFLASADWMTRNLSKRVEVAFPIFDPHVEALLTREMQLQLHDGLNGRVVNTEAKNEYVSGVNERSSQELLFEVIREFEEAYE